MFPVSMACNSLQGRRLSSFCMAQVAARWNVCWLCNGGSFCIVVHVHKLHGHRLVARWPLNRHLVPAEPLEPVFRLEGIPGTTNIYCNFTISTNYVRSIEGSQIGACLGVSLLFQPCFKR